MELPQSNGATLKTKLSWPDDAAVYQPIEPDHMLLPERASCLAVKAFLHMCQLPYTTVLCSNADSMSPGGRLTKLPFLRIGDCVFSEFEPIINYVNERNLGTIQYIDETAKNDVCAQVAFVENNYTLAGLYMCFVNASVYEEVTTAHKNTVYPWPFNLVQNFVRRNKAMEMLRVYQWDELSLSEVIELVDKCSKELSNTLEEHPDMLFFGGQKPCELDAIVYGHIQTILTAKLPNMALAQTISKYERLIELCQRIDEKYSKPIDQQQQAINETMYTKVSHEVQESQKLETLETLEEATNGLNEANESSESRDTEESQEDTETEESQESSYTEDSQEAEESQESSETGETQESQEVEESQESSDTDETQESRDTEDTQESHDTADESEESQDSEESQKSDESQEGKELPVSNDLAELKQSEEAQKSQEAPKSTEQQTKLEIQQNTKEGHEVQSMALESAKPHEAQLPQKAHDTHGEAQLPQDELLPQQQQQQPQQEQQQQEQQQKQEKKQEEGKLQAQEDKILETTKNA